MNKSRSYIKYEQLMRYVIGNFLEEGETFGEFFGSRKSPRPNVRHLLRMNLYHHYGLNYTEIAKIEGILRGETPHHTTIIHSLNKPPEKFKHYDEAYKTMRGLILEFEELWSRITNPDAKKRIHRFMEWADHQKALYLLVIDYNWLSTGDIADELKHFTSDILKA